MKQTMQRRGVLTVAILMMFVLVFAGMFIASMTGSNKSARAADYSYNENVNTVTWDDDTGLTVVFTCEYNELGMFDWALFLFNSEDFENVPYDEYTHKLTNSSSMGQDSASYYFDSDVSTETGTITVTYGKDQTAEGKSKTLAEIWAEDDWRVVIGPHHDYYGNAYNCDYYVGSRQTIMSSTPALPPIYIGKQWMNGDAFNFNDNVDDVYILPPEEDSQRISSWQDRVVTFVSKGNGFSLYTINDFEYFKILDEGHTEAPVGIELVSGDGTEENPYVFKGVWTLEFTISVVQEQNDIVENGNVGRPYASVNDMDSVTVRYDITKNPGIHNLLAVLDYDHTAFTLGQVAYPDPVTALGEPTPNGDVPDSFVWDITGDAYDELKEGFLTVTFLINNVVSGTEYTFGLKITPYVMNASTVAYHINTINNQHGEQSNVPVTQIVKTFTPVVRQEAVIEIGGSEYVGTNSTINPNGRRYRRTYANRQFTTLKVDADVSTSDYFDYEAGLWTSAEDAFVVHYTYNGDAQPVIDWMSYADAEAYIADNTYQYTSISAPTNPGQYAVIISAPATLNYYAAAPVLCEVKIERLTMSISIANAGHTYLDDPQTIAVSGVVEGVGVTVTPYLIINDTHVQPSSSTPAAVYNIYYDVEITDNSVFTIYSISVNGTAVFAEVSEGNPNRTYTVTPKEVTITINAASHTYGDSAMGQLTWELSSEVPNAEITLTTTAGLESPADEYPITISSYDVGSNYTLTNPSATGTYTINKKSVTLRALDQSAAFTGSIPTVDQSMYELSGATGDVTITIVENENSWNPGQYSLIPSIDLSSSYYDVSITNGIFTITSAPEAVAHFTPFFSGATLPYNAQSQNLLIVGDITENWWNYTPETFNRTDVGDYQITITITVKEGYQSSYTLKDGNNETVDQLTFSVTGHITAIPITIRAIGGSHVYGNSPSKNYATPTLDQEYEITEGTYYNDNLNISMSINTANDLLTSTTNAGTYTVTLTASNANYVISYYNNDNTATYTVNKATPSIDLVANNVYYNRDLDVTATVTPNVGDATITYYSDYECQNALVGEPVNAGTYYVKASVIETTNYNSCESEVRSFIIDTVRLSNVDSDSLQYSGGTVTWGSVTTDSGHMENEPGVDPKALIDPTQVTYYVYSFDMVNEVTTLVATILPGAERTFTAQAETFYYITADVTSNANYTESGNTEAGFTYAVTFDCDHTTHTDYEITSHSGLPNTMYVFQGQSITLPALEALTNEYSFKQWKLGNTTYNANASYEVNESVAFNAIWSKNAYKIYLKYFNTFTAYELNLEHGDDITYSPSALALLGTFTGYEGVNAADYRVAGWKYNNAVVYTISNFNAEEINLGITATADGMVFDAVLEFAIDYYMLEGTAAGAEAYENVEPVTEFVEYNTTIAYRAIDQAYTWFKTDCWYTDANRTAKNAPATMPASRVSVYGAYKFDIGYGDVDGNGDVNTDDITLYRKWIVGGYAMTVVEVGNEWATVTDENFEYVEGAFFLKRVADINADNSKDVRDVTITRMAFVGGYDWDIESGIRVTGESIERTKTSYNATALVAGLNAGRARLYDGIITDDAVVIVKESGDIYLDLNGYNLKVGSLTLVTNGYGSTITICNGRIIANEGGNITVSAPNGNVVLDNVETYVKDTQINLQAASSSLHLFNKVEFYDYKNTAITVTADTITVENDATVPAAPINVAEGTHVVVELAAQITVDVIKVATITIDTNNNNAVSVDTNDETRAITLTNNTEVAIEEKVTVGTVTEVDELIKVTTKEELIAANGKTVYLFADINTGNDYIAYSEDTTINLNGHTITFDKWGFEINSGATMTVNGNGSVSAVQACFDIIGSSLYLNGGTYTTTANCAIFCHEESYLEINNATITAQEACVAVNGNSEAVIDNGTFTSIDNFVVGTNGTAGLGGNEITINGGTFNGGITSAGYVACGIYVANDDTVVVNGGTFNITNGVGILSRSGSTTVNAGTFNVTGNGVAGKIGDSRVVLPSGAVLVVDLAAGYPGGDPVLTNNTAYDVYTVVGNAEELAAATGNVVLGENINCTSDIVYASDVTLNLNGHNITFSGWGFEVRNGATFTINGNGNVTAAEAALYAQYAGKLIVNGGTYTSTNNFVIGTNGSANRGGNEITINGGVFNGSINAEGYVACGIYVANNDTVAINAGTFNITNGVGILARSGSTTVNAGTFNVTGNGVAGKIGDSRVVLPSGAVLVVDLAANYPGGDPTLVNETAYAVHTIVGNEQELTAASGNVVLGANITVNDGDGIVYSQDTTLNLNGYNITFSGWGFEVRNNATFTINGNGNVNAVEACLYAQYAGTLIVNGGNYTSTDNFVIGTNGTSGRGGNIVTVNGGVFNGSITTAGYIACGIYIANSDTVVINAGTFNIVDGVAIVARSGNTTIKSGVVLNVTGETRVGKVGDKNYSITSGHEITQDMSNPQYPGGQPTVVNQTSYQTVVLE